MELEDIEDTQTEELDLYTIYQRAGDGSPLSSSTENELYTPASAKHTKRRKKQKHRPSDPRYSQFCDVFNGEGNEKRAYQKVIDTELETLRRVIMELSGLCDRLNAIDRSYFTLLDVKPDSLFYLSNDSVRETLREKWFLVAQSLQDACNQLTSLHEKEKALSLQRPHDELVLNRRPLDWAWYAARKHYQNIVVAYNLDKWNAFHLCLADIQGLNAFMEIIKTHVFHYYRRLLFRRLIKIDEQDLRELLAPPTDGHWMVRQRGCY